MGDDRPANMSARARSNGTCREGQWRKPAITTRRLDLCELAGMRRSATLSLQCQRRAGPGGTRIPASASAIRPRCSCRCSRRTSPATAGTSRGRRRDNYNAANNWWNDGTENSSGSTRQKNMTKYFDVRPYGATSLAGHRPERRLHDKADNAAHRCHDRRRASPPSSRRSTRWRPTATPMCPRAPPGAGAPSPAASRSRKDGRKPKRATTRSSSC